MEEQFQEGQSVMVFVEQIQTYVKGTIIQRINPIHWAVDIGNLIILQKWTGTVVTGERMIFVSADQIKPLNRQEVGI